ncbi:MAG TPA: hypothetical protein VHX88_09800 [Solirubrobacteraceae bacterium]|nr:hypothetical protein [Solirubrobacteraceae bacterium]
MSDSASALSLRPGRLPRTAERDHEQGRRALVIAAATAALATLVVGSAMLVLISASRSTFLTPTTDPAYFPRWMAGPLAGIWPRAPISDEALRWLVSGLLGAMYLGYAVTVGVGARIGARWVIGVILAVHVLFLLAPPLQYTDVFNYINYGRMGVVHHLNPYATAPILEPHGDPAFALSNWHWLVSPYGPLFTLFTYALVPLGVAGSFWALKVVICLASLTTLALVWRCAELLGRDRVRAIALVGLNPLVLLWELGADHNDILMMPALMLSVYLLLRARACVDGDGEGAGRGRLEALAAAALVPAIAIKAAAAVVVPVAFAAAPRRRAFLAGLVGAGVVMGALSVLFFGMRLPGVGTQTSLVTDVGPPNLIGWLIGTGGETNALRTLLTAGAGFVVLGATLLALRRDRDWLALAGIALATVWLTTSWFTPWYVVWMLPFAALAVRPRLTVAMLAIGAYLLVAFGPEVSPLLHTLHFNPDGSSLGLAHSTVIDHLVQ